MVGILGLVNLYGNGNIGNKLSSVGIKTIGYDVSNLVKVTICFYAYIREVICSIVLKTSKFALLVLRFAVRANPRR